MCHYFKAHTSYGTFTRAARLEGWWSRVKCACVKRGSNKIPIMCTDAVLQYTLCTRQKRQFHSGIDTFTRAACLVSHGGWLACIKWCLWTSNDNNIPCMYHVMYKLIQYTTYMYTLHYPWHVIFILSCIPAVKTALWLHVIDAGCLAALDWDGSVETWKQHVHSCTQWLMQCTFNNLQFLHATLWQPYSL